MGEKKKDFFFWWVIKFHQPKIKWTTQHINYTMKKQGATQPLAHASKWLGRKRKWSWNIYSMQSIPAQDFMVRILRSRTTMLRRWVMSPNNRNKFMIAALSLSHNCNSFFPLPFFSSPLSWFLVFPPFLSSSFFWGLRTRVVDWPFFQAAKSIPYYYYVGPKKWIWTTTTYIINQN